MKSFRADYVFPVYADPIKNGIVTVDDSGQIIAVADSQLPAEENIEHLEGIICPGFVNTHCHLELSHLRNKVTPHGGLIQFIKDVQSLRTADPAQVLEAAEQADQEMFENGIIAVGDISNSAASIPVKAKSKLFYHSFLELFSFLPERAQDVFDKALALAAEFKPLRYSLTPHAPYTVSKELFKLIKKYTDTHENLLSIHNQECEDENKFYRYKMGGFIDLYQHFGINIDYFKPQARNSIQSVVPLLSNKQKILMVHNTCTNLKDVYFVKRFDRKITWCFCPAANLYIENRLPKVDLFIDQGFNITLGTDSLASNNKLSVLNEMQILQQHMPALKLTDLITWGTQNGASFLGIDDQFGTLRPGKKPGLNLITHVDGLKLTPDSKVKRLI
jgi:cytosine/adenosine deaminase-related metal-dependent hydrolase